MPLQKRKREFSDEEKILHASTKELQREIKKVLRFEIQKAMKHLKKPIEETKDSSDMKLEKWKEKIHYLKTLDHVYLSKYILKQKGYSIDMENIETKDQEESFLTSIYNSVGKLQPIQNILTKVESKFQILHKEQAKRKKTISNSSIEPKKKKKKKILIGGRSSVPPSSVFLASLNGSGESDVFHDSMTNNPDDDIAEFLGEKKSKNRPGQRERRRRAIEREKREAEKAQRIKDNKYGPPLPSNQKKSKFKKPMTMNNTKTMKNENEKPLKFKQKEEKQDDKDRNKSNFAKISNSTKKSEHLHPSWIAKQAQKEKEKVNIHAFSGKKITFDD